MRLLIDMDDVLADTGAKILDVFNQRNGLQLEKSFFEDKHFYEYIKGHNSYRDALYEPGFFRDIKVFPDAIDVVKELNEKFEVYIVSAATEFPLSLTEKMEWLDEHFPFISWRNRVFCGDKSIVHGDIMIDDHARNFENFSGRKILFHSMHNTQVQGYERVKSWREIRELIGCAGKE